MRVTGETASVIVRRQIGKLVRASITETGKPVSGLFIGFWNPDFADNNSQTTRPTIIVLFPFNILTEKGARIAVDEFTVQD